jgi:hypothetical protein
LDELGEQLRAEHAVVIQSLIAAFEVGYVGAGVFPPVPSDGTGRRSRHASRSDQRSGTRFV